MFSSEFDDIQFYSFHAIREISKNWRVRKIRISNAEIGSI